MPILYAPILEQAGFVSGGDAPENYVARLDGVSQYWQLSQGVPVGVGDRIKFNISAPLSNYATVFASNNSVSVWCYIEDENRIVIRVNETSFLGIGFDSIISGDVTLDFYPDRIECYNKGVTRTRYDAVPNFTIERLGSRESTFGILEGYIKDFQLSVMGGNTTNEIPLTNKAQGATQLPTVGTVSATMVNYTSDVWEQV